MICHDPNHAFRLVRVEHASLTVYECQARTNIWLFGGGSVPSAMKPRETVCISFRKWFNLISQTVLSITYDQKLEVIVKCRSVLFFFAVWQSSAGSMLQSKFTTLHHEEHAAHLHYLTLLQLLNYYITRACCWSENSYVELHNPCDWRRAGMLPYGFKLFTAICTRCRHN